MHLCEEFQKHADECRRTARITKDSATKAIWNAMADRWAKAAQIHSHSEQQVEAARRARFRRINVQASHNLGA